MSDKYHPTFGKTSSAFVPRQYIHFGQLIVSSHKKKGKLLEDKFLFILFLYRGHVLLALRIVSSRR